MVNPLRRWCRTPAALFLGGIDIVESENGCRFRRFLRDELSPIAGLAAHACPKYLKRRIADRGGVYRDIGRSASETRVPRRLEPSDRRRVLAAILHRRSCAMRMKVSHDQFEIHADKLRHGPTGALFWMGETDVVSCELGLAGTEMGTGHRYDPEELKQAAYEVFKLERGKCS